MTDLQAPRDADIVDPFSRFRRRVSRKSIAADVQTVFASKLRDVFDGFLDELAALIVMADANASKPVESDRRRSTESPLPSFRSVWAERRLDQVSLLLHWEKEALAGWLHRPYDPDVRPDVCGECGQPPSRGDLFCRQCGARLRGEVDERLRLRRRCGHRGCGLENVPVPTFVRSGRTWIELPAACTVCGEALEDQQ